MLISEASDLWETEGKGAGHHCPGDNGFECLAGGTQKHLVRAALCRLPGDVVTEDDCIDGLLKNYDVLYVCGQNLHRKAAAAIRSWVAEGGVPLATAGAARKDQFDEPLTELDEVLGRGKSVAYRRYRAAAGKAGAGFREAARSVALGRWQANAGLLQPGGVRGFAGSSGSGHLRHREAGPNQTSVGKGWAYYTGTLPGQTWAKAALPVSPQGKGGPNRWPWMQEFLGHDPVAEAIILMPLAEAAIAPDVQVSQRGVIVNTLQASRSSLLTVVNLALEAKGQLQDVQIVVAGVPRVARAWSCFHRDGSLLEKFDQGKVTIRLPSLGPADVVVLEHE